MKELINVKEKIEDFYRAHSAISSSAGKALLFLLLGISIPLLTGRGYDSKGLLLFSAGILLCAVLPSGVISFLTGILILYQLHSGSLLLFGLVFMAMFCVLLLQGALQAGYAVLIALTIAAFLFRIPFLLPLIAGLFCAWTAVIPIVLGTLLYFYLAGVLPTSELWKGKPEVSEAAKRLSDLAVSYASGKTMLLFLFSMSLCFLLVFWIRHTEKRGAWQLAVLSGSIAALASIFAGLLLKAEGIGIVLVLTTVLTAGIGYFCADVFRQLDFSRAEELKFEDEDYLYFVKAVPKKRR